MVHHGEKLKKELKMLKITQEELAAKLGISRNYLITKLKEYQFKDDFKQNVITILGLDNSFFTENVPEILNKPLQSPTINQQKNGAPYYDVDFIGGFDLIFNDQAVKPTFYIDFMPYNDVDCWINITGKSMGPLIAHGDIVALKQVPDWKRFLLEGEIYAIITDNGFRTVKMIGAGPDKDHYMLIPYNKSEEYKPQAIPKDVITHIFRVKGSIKKFF